MKSLSSLILFCFGFAVARDFSFYDGLGPHKVIQGKIGDEVIWYPDPATSNINGSLPVYQFICGTAQAPVDYRATVHHVASHGFFVISNIMDLELITLIESTRAIKNIIGGTGLPAGITVDPLNIAVGGHSGGGPEAAFISGRFSQNVRAYIGQHAAAIPLYNKPSEKQLAAITGQVLQICGTDDVMPFCGCGVAEKEYFDLYPESTRRMLMECPDGHVDGTEGVSGNKLEGGIIVAFLYHALLNDTDARPALNAPRKGYKVTDKLG